MTLEAKKSRAYVATLLGASSFGIWQRSFVAGCFMFIVLLLFSGLVVAIQDGLNGSDPEDEA